VALTKGVGFWGARSFIESRFGITAQPAACARLSPKDRATIDAVVPVGWYDLALYVRYIRAIDEVLGAGDLRLIAALGRFEAERDLTVIHQFFLRLSRPSLAIEQMNKYWRRFHDTGEWITDPREREVTAKLVGWGVVDSALCRELVGYLGRTLELCGGRDVHVDHRRCRARGDELCDFHAVWRAKDELVATEGAGSS
jgi:predicted hydrocarbon binding protein